MRVDENIIHWALQKHWFTLVWWSLYKNRIPSSKCINDLWFTHSERGFWQPPKSCHFISTSSPPSEGRDTTLVSEFGVVKVLDMAAKHQRINGGNQQKQGGSIGQLAWNMQKHSKASRWMRVSLGNDRKENVFPSSEKHGLSTKNQVGNAHEG